MTWVTLPPSLAVRKEGILLHTSFKVKICGGLQRPRGLTRRRKCSASTKSFHSYMYFSQKVYWPIIEEIKTKLLTSFSGFLEDNDRTVPLSGDILYAP